MVDLNGIVVGSDRSLEWILPWWWEHYSAHNSYPVAFADFGMSEKALAWCLERGTILTIGPSSLGSAIIPEKKEEWERRFGPRIWKYRTAWFKKPLALLLSPFSQGLWLDLDCRVGGSLEPLFHALFFGADIGIVRDVNQQAPTLLPGEVNYNSGVIVYRQGAPTLQRWLEIATRFEGELAGDQDALSRAIYLHRPAFVELPDIYNWNVFQGENESALIHHFCNEAGKLQILESLRSTLPLC